MATEQNILTHLENMEDYRTTGYIVSGTRNSGITIAYGVDLSQPPYNTEQGLRDAGFSEEFISKCVELDILGKTAGQIQDENRDPSAIAKQIKIPDTKEEKERQGKLFIEKNKKLNSKYADAMDDKTFVSYSTMNHWGGGKGMSKEERDAISDPTTLSAIDRKAYVIGVINDDIDAKIEENGTITSEEYSQIIYNGQNSVENFRRDSPMNTDTLNRERAFVGDVDNYMNVEARNEFIEQQDNEYSQSEEVVEEETTTETGCISGDCVNGQGTYIYANAAPGYSKGDKYVGEFKDGRKHGKGKNVRNDGNEYVIWHYNGEHITEGSPSISQEFYNREEEDRRAGLSPEERDKEDEKKYKVVLDAEGNEIRIPIGPDVTEEEIEQARQEEVTGVKTYENWEDVYKDDTLDRSQTIQVGPNTYKWKPDEGAEDDKNAGNYLIVNEQGEFVPYENNETQLIVQTERRNQVLGISDEVVVEEEEEGPGIVVKEESSRVTNTDGSITVTYTDGTTEVIPAPVVETDVIETPDITTEDEGPGLMEKIGSGVGATLKGAGTLLDSIGGPSAIISYIMGKEGLKHAMKEIEPQKMPELSPLFHQHLRQTRELAKKGFHPAEARKIRKEIDAAYEQGLDNAVRGTSGDRAKFLAQSGILDSKRSSALLDFATQDAALQRENQDKYVDTMMFKENFEAQRSEKLRAEDMQMQLMNKQSAAQFTSAAFSNLMSGLGGGNSALIRQMMQMYQGGGTTKLFDTVNPNQ